jgi:hypothetical protein
MIRKGLARRVGPALIQLLRSAVELAGRMARTFWDGPLGVGNLVPFSRSRNPLLAPDKLHYETPKAGDRGCFARHRRKLLRVSGRLAPELRLAY